MQDRNGTDPEQEPPDESEPTRTEAAPNVVRLTPREDASLRVFVQWQLPEQPEPEKGDL
jgi:hypothetical protein